MTKILVTNLNSSDLMLLVKHENSDVENYVIRSGKFLTRFTTDKWESKETLSEEDTANFSRMRDKMICGSAYIW